MVSNYMQSPTLMPHCFPLRVSELPGPKCLHKAPPPTQAPDSSSVGSLTKASLICLLRLCMGMVGGSRDQREAWLPQHSSL